MKPPTGSPCKECPFRRASASGWLGRSDPEDFIATTMADTPMPCHLTVDYEDKDWKEKLSDANYCSGALIFFRNTCKLSRDSKRPQLPANNKLVFSSPREFLEHHDQGSNQPYDIEKIDVLYFPKKCPKCSSIMRSIQKMSMTWLECVKDVCGYRCSFNRR